MDTTVLKEYRKNRTPQYFTGNNGEPYCHQTAAGFAFGLALRKIDTQRAWDNAGDNVRLRWDVDETADLDDLAGDTYDEKVNFDIRPSIIRRQKQEFIELVEREGVWGLIGEYYDGEEWHQVDSIWGLVGQDESGYELGIMSATVEAYNGLEFCPHCGRPITH